MQDKYPLNLEGELTIYNANDTKRRLMASLDSTTSLDVDLSAVTDLDSAGLQLLVLAWREAGKSGKTLRYINASPAVEELLEFCNLTRRLNTATSTVARG